MAPPRARPGPSPPSGDPAQLSAIEESNRVTARGPGLERPPAAAVDVQPTLTESSGEARAAAAPPPLSLSLPAILNDASPYVAAVIETAPMEKQ